MKKSLLILSISMSLLLVLFACSANNTKSQVDYGYLRLDGSMTNR